MKIKLDLNDYLSDQLKIAATKRHQSVEEVATDILQEAAKSGNLEQRQFIGKTISGKDIIKHDDLVLLSGIYYRYHIVDDQPVDRHLDYEVVDSKGNLIILKAKAG